MESAENSAQGAPESMQLALGQLEALLFTLGTEEVFGVNVHKTKEVSGRPELTRLPNSPKGVVGLFSLRGEALPALDLAAFLGIGEGEENARAQLVIAEFGNTRQGFLVHELGRIARLEWSEIRSPKQLGGASSDLVSGIGQLADGRMVCLLDFEQIVARAFGEKPIVGVADKSGELSGTALFVDDSAFARKQIASVFSALGLPARTAENGRAGWEALLAWHSQCQAQGVELRSQLKLIMTDAEMPELDGYSLCKMIKSDPRFNGIPVIMHSSLATAANKSLGQKVGADGYVGKFDAEHLAKAIESLWLKD